MSWTEVRAQFPSLRKWTYLNTATYGLVPLRSRRAVEAHFDRRDELACQDFLSWFDDLAVIRADIGKLIGATGDDIAFVGNAATPLSYFLGSMDWRAGDKIATLENEFPNQYAYAGHLAERGVELVELTDLSLPLPRGTKAVIASSVSYTSGKRADLPRLRQLADAAGALFYVDATQSLGALQLDIQTVRPDLLAVDAYKWMLSPNGAGFFYISPAFRKKLTPPVIGWRSDHDWRNVAALHNGAPRFPETAEKYEGGMVDFPSIYAMGESVKLMLELGPAAVESRILELTGYLTDRIAARGGDILYPDSNILSIGFEGRDIHAIAAGLRAEKVLVSTRLSRLRISCHFYNNEQDIDALVRALPF